MFLTLWCLWKSKTRDSKLVKSPLMVLCPRTHYVHILVPVEDVTRGVAAHGQSAEGALFSDTCSSNPGPPGGYRGV